jgi:hypothetical protein
MVVTGVMGAASTVGSIGLVSEAATPLESRMWDDVTCDVQVSLKTL